MTVDATSGASASAAADSLSRKTLAGNFDSFLTLLTAQLQHQDPLSPMDSNQFTQQLVQFSQVEQQIQTNENLSSLLDQSKAAAAGAALSYLGRDAVLQSSTTALGTNGALWAYNLPSGASSLKIEVRDSSNRTVYTTTTGDRSSGSHAFTWDGKNSAGVAQAAGAYTLVVTAKDSDGNTITPSITTRETVIGLDLGADNPTVLTASGTHDLSTIRAILSQ